MKISSSTVVKLRPQCTTYALAPKDMVKYCMVKYIVFGDPSIFTEIKKIKVLAKLE